MCLILFSYRRHPGYPFIFAANRDEFYARPTTPAAFWEDDPDVLAGRDLQGGGTWMGVTRGGRFAALTNYRAPGQNREGAPSRGALVAGFLQGRDGAAAFLERLSPDADRYNGFNLLVGDAEGLYYFSNFGGTPRSVPPGLYGLSNHLLDTPWPKVVRGKEALEAVLKNGGLSPGGLLDLLNDTRQAPDEDLPETGVGLDLERLLSPLFITSPAYGTRSSSVMLLAVSGNARFVERTYLPDSSGKHQERHYSFRLPRGGFTNPSAERV